MAAPTLVNRPNRLDSVGMFGAPVRPLALEPGKAQRQAARILGAGLNIIEGDFHYKLGAQINGVSIAAGLQLLKLPRLPFERLVRQPFERLQRVAVPVTP